MFSKTFPVLCFVFLEAGSPPTFFLWPKDNTIFVYAFLQEDIILVLLLIPWIHEVFGVLPHFHNYHQKYLRQRLPIDHDDILPPKNILVGKLNQNVHVLPQKQREGCCNSELLVHAKTPERNFFIGLFFFQTGPVIHRESKSCHSPSGALGSKILIAEHSSKIGV